MPFSYTEYTGDGSTTDFTITFPYLDQDHVFVTVNGLITTDVSSLYEFTFVNATTVRVVLAADGTSAVPSATPIRVGRDTNIDTAPVTWSEGAALTTTDLNKLSNYLTYALQESLDANEGAALATLAKDAAEAAKVLAEAAATAAAGSETAAAASAAAANASAVAAAASEAAAGLSETAAAASEAAAAASAASIGPDAVFDSITVDTTTLVVDKTNNRVGVLTATPSYTLDVGAGGVLAAPTVRTGSLLDASGNPYTKRIYQTVYDTDSTTFTSTSTTTYATGAQTFSVIAQGTGSKLIGSIVSTYTVIYATTAVDDVRGNIRLHYYDGTTWNQIDLGHTIGITNVGTPTAVNFYAGSVTMQFELTAAMRRSDLPDRWTLRPYFNVDYAGNQASVAASSIFAMEIDP